MQRVVAQQFFNGIKLANGWLLNLLLAFGLLLFLDLLVMRENTFSASNIRVEQVSLSYRPARTRSRGIRCTEAC